jgi:hypothetical protein
MVGTQKNKLLLFFLQKRIRVELEYQPRLFKIRKKREYEFWLILYCYRFLSISMVAMASARIMAIPTPRM